MKKHLQPLKKYRKAFSTFWATGLLFSQLHANNSFVDPQVKDFPAIVNTPSTFDLISHGRPGELLLDGKWRNAAEIVSFLKNKHFLYPGLKQLNIYGCEFGKGAKGLRAVTVIKKTLGISVAASDNITGKHGDWILEIGKTTHSLNEPAYAHDLQTICKDTTFTAVTTGWSTPPSTPPYDPPAGCINNSGTTGNGTITDYYGAGFYTFYDSPSGCYWSRTLSGLDPSKTYRVTINITSYDNGSNGRYGYFQNYNLAGQTGTFSATPNTNIPDQQNFVLFRNNTSSLSFGGTIVAGPWDNCLQAVNYYVRIFVDQISNITDTYPPPIPSASSITNICPATTSNLTGLASGCGTGSNLEWHTTNVGYSAATKLANITSVANGTYYAVCFNATRSCYSGPSSAVTVNNVPCPPLPIELKSISATWENNDAILSWVVANESNMSYYSIEKSMDGTNFTQTGKVNSIGNHVTDHNYTFRDPDMRYRSINDLFYRLKQIDKDGRYKTSPIVSLTDSKLQATALVYPNPFTGNHLNFIYQSDIQNNIELNIEITDIYGRKIYKTKAGINKGKNLITIPFTSMVTGSYFLKFTNKEYNIKGIIRLENI